MSQKYALISFVKRGVRRHAILRHLAEPKTPKQIATGLKLSISNVSNSLTELKKKGLVECLNPEDHLIKFYKQTKKGAEILRFISEL